MANYGNEKRHRLFDLYSKHFSRGDPVKREIFVCPLCLYGFIRDDCVGPNPSVTLAHFISKQLGGKRSDCTLECTDCNSGVGTDLESALVERFEADDFAAGIGRMGAQLKGHFGEVRVEYEFADSKRAMRIYGIPKQSNPKHRESLHDHLTQVSADPRGEFQFSLTPDYRHQPRKVQVALFHSAYLLMFHCFGYPFVYHPHFAPLRDQIARPDEQIWTTRIFVDDGVTHGLPIAHRAAVLFLREPEAILAAFRLQRKGGRERKVAVILPGLDSPEMPSGDHPKIKGAIIPHRPEALVDKGSYLHAAWRHTRVLGPAEIKGPNSLAQLHSA